MKLYSLAPQDCSGKVCWLLNEMGIEFEEIKMDWKKGDLKTTEYLAKHPMGQVPLLEDGDFSLYESYAIVSYLAEKYPEKKMAPAVSDLKERAIYNQWMFFSTDTAEDFFGRHFKLPKMDDEYKKEWGDYIVDKTQKVMSTIEKQLNGKEYLLGAFSAVDTCLGYSLNMVCEETFFNDYPNVKSYYERLTKREACKKSAIFKRD